jgi:hypothetical protein
MTPVRSQNLQKYFETCASYMFSGTTSTGVYVKFTFGTGAKLTVFVTNAQLEPYM